MPSEMQKKALKDGLLTQKQYDKLPSALLDGIIKSKMKNGGGKKPKAKPSGAGASRVKGATRKAKPSGPKGKKGKKK
jgi:hypothetical protein